MQLLSHDFKDKLKINKTPTNSKRLFDQFKIELSQQRKHMIIKDFHMQETFKCKGESNHT